LVFILSGYAIYLAWVRHEVASGILLALGFCVKPTSAVAVVPLLVLYGRKKSILTFLGASALITSCAALVMSRINPVWKLDYANNLQFLFGPDGAASFWTKNLGRFDLVNLQVPFYAIVHSVPIANLLAVAASAILATLWILLFFLRRGTKSDWSWLAVSSLVLLGLLPVYQRNYNAGFVLFAAMWAFENIHEALAKAALLVSGVFLIPGEAILRKAGLADRLSGSALWNSLVMSQLTWGIVTVIIICYVYELKKVSVGCPSAACAARA
jgi:hypothetical protein